MPEHPTTGIRRGAGSLARSLARIPLFANVAPEELDHIAAAAYERHLSRGETLFQKGDMPHGFFLVTRGQIKLAVSNVKGQEKVVDVLCAGHSFGEAVLFLDAPYPVFAQAVFDSTVVAIPRLQILELLAREPSVARRMLSGMAERICELMRDLEIYSQRSGTRRLAEFILRAAENSAAATQMDRFSIDLPSPKQVLASRISLTPEAFSRSLHELAERGLIKIHGKHLDVPDLEKLRQFDAQ